MKDQRKFDIKVGGYQVNTEQRGTNEQQGKDYKTRWQEVEHTKTIECENIF